MNIFYYLVVIFIGIPLALGRTAFFSIANVFG
jgi:hypothetical protein